MHDGIWKRCLAPSLVRSIPAMDGGHEDVAKIVDICDMIQYRARFTHDLPYKRVLFEN